MEGTSIGVVDLLLSAFSHPTVFAFFCFFGRDFFRVGIKELDVILHQQEMEKDGVFITSCLICATMSLAIK